MAKRFSQRGLRLYSKKEPAASLDIIRPTNIRQVSIPIKTETGLNCELVVDFDTVVKPGQKLAAPLDGEGLCVYSSVAGVVTKTYESTHPVLGAVTYVIVECSTMDIPETIAPQEISLLTPEEICQLAESHSIIDELDGTPLYKKLRNMMEAHPSVVFADAIEDEAYQSSAWGTIYEDFFQVITGLRLIAQCAGTERYQIASAMPRHYWRHTKEHVDSKYLYLARPNFYPHDDLQHMEKEECRVGVQACRALFRAAAYDEPQIECLLTINGDAVSLPANVRVPVGTSLRLALEIVGGDPEALLVLGDNMKGVEISSVDVPIVPSMTCILCLKEKTLPNPTVCQYCGLCARVCHRHLMPFEIARRYENKQYSFLPALHPGDCDGCNACSFACPAHREVAEAVAGAKEESSINQIMWEVTPNGD